MTHADQIETPQGRAIQGGEFAESAPETGALEERVSGVSVSEDSASRDSASTDNGPTDIGSGDKFPTDGAPNGDDVYVEEGDIAGDYLERLLDILDLDGDIDLDVERDRAVVAIVGEDLDELVGPQGATLEALQELTRLAVMAKTDHRSRLMLDVGGHRAQRRVELTEIGVRAADRAADSGERVVLAPMSPFERKVVHDAVATDDRVDTESEGQEPERRVVIIPTGR